MAAVTEQWCDDCGRLISPVAAEDGSPHCPRCHKELAPPKAPDDEAEHPKAPWHFKVLVVGTVGYLIYRVIWFIGWISHHA